MANAALLVMQHRRQTEIAIVADDLTGAFDTAAPFAAIGFETRAFLDAAPDRWPGPPRPAVLSVNLESRHLPAHVAEARVVTAVGFLAADGTRLLFKKIDSTLRGNVALEIVTALRASGRQHALIAPAVPAQGRVMREGEVLVHGVRLAECPIGRDLLSPPPRIPLAQALRAAAGDLAVHSWRRGQNFALLPGSGRQAYVVDAESDADLDAVAAFGIAHADEVLLVGAAGLSAAVARCFAAHRNIGDPRGIDRASGPILFVIGSRTPISEKQVEVLRAMDVREIRVPLTQGDESRLSLTDDCSPDATPKSDLIIRPGASSDPQHGAPKVAAMLGEAAATITRAFKPAALVVVGGDTAAAVFRALRIHHVALSGELLPGVAGGTIEFDGRAITFATKSGGFGNAGTLGELRRRLRGAL